MSTARPNSKLATLALVVTFLGCGAVYKMAGYPPEARRTTPPPGIEGRVVAVGQPAPRVVLADSAGASVTLGGAAERDTLIVFYRGHW